jgi:hypothetical protein
VFSRFTGRVALGLRIHPYISPSLGRANALNTRCFLHRSLLMKGVDWSKQRPRSQYRPYTLVYLDESAASEKVMFRRRSWSAISLPAYTRSELVSKVRCSVLPALDIHGYLPGATLVVERAVTQAIYEHWLETVVLLQSEPFPGKRSTIIMDNCSTHHSDKVSRLSVFTIAINVNRSPSSVCNLAYTCSIHHRIQHI